MKVFVLFFTLTVVAAAVATSDLNSENLSRTNETLEPIHENEALAHEEDEEALKEPSASQMNSTLQEMDQSRNSQHESMGPKDKLEENHPEHDQDLISFMKASDEHNLRSHSTDQKIQHESPLDFHGLMLQERYAQMMNAAHEADAGILYRWHHMRSSGGAYGPSFGLGMTPPYWGSASSGSATTSEGSGSGAVAVFPNAKAGHCGVPVLLSCSPSMVSGTLKKANSYSAPAYRAKSEHTHV